MASTIAGDLLLITRYISIYSNYIIFISGFIGNCLNILIFTSIKSFRINQCVFYLISESFSNIIQLIVFFLIRILLSINEIDPANYTIFWCKFRSMLIVLSTIISFSAICFASIDQYFSTSHRFNLRKFSTLKLARILIFIIICLSILHSISFLIFLEIRYSICTVFNIGMTNYLSFFYYPILCGILPIFISSLFSILAYRNVRRIVRRQIPIIRRKLDQQLTAMVLVRIIIFVILTLPYAIQRIYSFNVKINSTDYLLVAIHGFISTITSTFFNLNYATPFYIFIISSSRFRRQVKHVLIKKYWRRFKRCCFCNNNQVYPTMELRSIDSSVELG